jgi:hypothetical protein
MIVVVDRLKPGLYIRNRYRCNASVGLTMAIVLLTKSSGSNTAYMVIFGSTSITILQRLSKTVEYSCRWSSGTLVNLMAPMPGAKDKIAELAGHSEERGEWLTPRHVLLLRSLYKHRGVVDLFLTWAAPLCVRVGYRIFQGTWGGHVGVIDQDC